MTPIADMVAEMLARGVDAEVIVLAVKAAEQASRPQQSADNPPTSADERRRAYDRERQRKIRGLRRQSADNPPTVTTPLLLTKLSLDPSEEKKELKKVRARKPNVAPLSADWQPNGKHFEAAEKLKIPNAAVLEKAEDMRLWARSTGAMKVDWDATFHGFLRRDAEKLAVYPTQKLDGDLSDDERARLFAKLREKSSAGQENTRERNELRTIGDGARQDKTHQRESPDDNPSDDQPKGHSGRMGGMAPLFSGPPRFRANSDEAGSMGDSKGNDGS